MFRLAILMLSSSAIEMYITERIRILLCKMHGFPIILVNVQWYKWGTHFEKVLRYVYVNDNGKTISPSKKPLTDQQTTQVVSLALAYIFNCTSRLVVSSQDLNDANPPAIPPEMVKFPTFTPYYSVKCHKLAEQFFWCTL